MKNNNYIKKNKGFSLIEMVIVLAIVAILSYIAVLSFSKTNSREALDKSVLTLISILNEAKSEAISSKNFSNYGVRIQKDRVISFQGTYGTDNKTYIFPTSVTISTSTGIGTDIIFKNTTGFTSASGTITFTTVNVNPQNKSIVRVFSTGAIERN